MAILGCTATLIFAFLPLMALPGGPGKFIRVLPVTVVSAIVGSLLIALFIIPFIASRVLKENEDPHGNRLLQRVMDADPSLLPPRAASRAGAPEGDGGRGHRRLAAALGRAGARHRHQPVPEGGYAAVPHQCRRRRTAPASRRRTRRCASSRASSRTLPAVKSWFTNLGHGNPQIYYNHIVRKDAPNYGEIFVQLKEYDTRETPRLLDELRAQARSLPGRAHLREGVRERPADQRADRRARHRARSRRASRSWRRGWRSSWTTRPARATCTIR